MKENPEKYREILDYAKANYVPVEEYLIRKKTESEPSELPWYRYKGLKNIDKARRRFSQDKPKEYQAYVESFKQPSQK